MAIQELFFDAGTSISTTEYSLPADGAYSAGAGITGTPAVVQVFVDFSAMVAGDQYEVKIYDAVYDASPITQKLISQATLTGPQSSLFVTPALILIHNWDVTVKRLAGSDRSIAWSIRGL